jgi:hypothetical protein
VKNEFTDESLSKKRLINELKELSRQIAELEKPESWRNHAEGVLHRAGQELELANDDVYGIMALRTQAERRKAQEKMGV